MPIFKNAGLTTPPPPSLVDKMCLRGQGGSWFVFYGTRKPSIRILDLGVKCMLQYATYLNNYFEKYAQL